MPKSLLRNIAVVIILSACGQGSKRAVSSTNVQAHPDTTHAVVPTPVVVIDNSLPISTDTITSKKPQSLMNLPASQDGEIILKDGFYEADFKSYCLQPGTPAPSAVDAYLQGPLSGYRKDIVETVLRNSLSKPYLEQKNIQLLLWSVVSGSDFNKLNSGVQFTARDLLTQKQIFKLQGGVMGIVKNVSSAIPETAMGGALGDMKKLFELGNSSYEAYERLAVSQQPSVINHPDYKKDQWYQQEDGYYIRYFPQGYKQVKVQVYVPPGTTDSTGKKAGEYVLFDPVQMMAIPANSNAQRLGIGAPIIIDVIRKVIELPKSPSPKQPTNPNTTKQQPTQPVYDPKHILTQGQKAPNS